MKARNMMLLFLSLLFFYPAMGEAQNQTGSMSGRISMPQIKKEKRTFRGRMYRNRLRSKKKAASKNKTLKSPYIDVVVILRPLVSKPDIIPMENIRMVQKDANFVPRVLPVTRNTVIDFINFDKFYHNVFSVTPGARFNVGRRPTGTVVRQKIERSGEIKLFCDIHAQMNAVILSLETPYFTRVNPDGTYRLDDLPSEDYLVEVYHPDLPNVEEQITIESGRVSKRNFTLSR
jgi:plastocyanin